MDRFLTIPPVRSLFNLSSLLCLTIILYLSHPFQASAQDTLVPFVGTPHHIVDKMHDMAGTGAGDYLIDLGSGDGRIVIEAARRGAVAHGVEIDAEQVELSDEHAAESGADNRVLFLQEDIFDTDLSRATIITMYLSPSVNIELRPKLLEQLAPGTIIVSHLFDMGEWRPDRSKEVGRHSIHYWKVPADLSGIWNLRLNGRQYQLSIEQKFQEISVQVQSGTGDLTVTEATLHGTRLTLFAEHPDGYVLVLNGRIENGVVSGFAQLESEDGKQLRQWRAERVRSGRFE
jgi:hypothetical protein